MEGLWYPSNCQSFMMDRFGAEMNFKSVTCHTRNSIILVNSQVYKYCKLQNLHW